MKKNIERELTRNSVVNIGTGFTIRNSVEELPIPIPTPLYLPPLLHILKISKVLFPQSALFPNSHDSILLECSTSSNNLFHGFPRSTRGRNVEQNLPLLMTFTIFRHDLLDSMPRCLSLMDSLLYQLDLVIRNVLENCFVLVDLALAMAYQYDSPREVLRPLLR